MKVLVTYYSWKGHTEKVAQALASKINAQTLRVEQVKDSSMPVKAMKALFGLKSNIKPCRTDLKDVDYLVVACPVWAGHMPPCMHTYLSKLTDCSGKPFSVLAEEKSQDAEKMVGQIRKVLEKKGMKFVSWTYMLEATVDAGKYDETLKRFTETIKAP